MTYKESINKKVGQNIQEHRKSIGWSQDQLSSAIGLTRTSIVNIEKGRQSLSVECLLKCCAVMKLNPMDILPNVPKVSMKPKTETVKVVTKNTIKSNFKF